MNNVLLEYMSKRLKKEELKFREAGPVITISRQFGCDATETAVALSAALTKHSPNPWNYITKEILEDSAKKLDVDEKEIAHIFGANEKNFLGDLIISFSKGRYASDSNIKRTLKMVVRKYAEQGNCIIVGRAGCIIARDIPLSLHVRLTAPLDYRIKSVKEELKISEKEALILVNETDKKRELFMSFYKGSIENDDFFDISLNKHKMNEKEILDTIIGLAKSRTLI